MEWSTDQQQFQQLAEPHRYQLQVHCYRMLGSLHEAEDLVQETFLRAWRAREQFEGRASFRNWLYRIATNACLNVIASRAHARRLLPDAYGPAAHGPLTGSPPGEAEVAWLEPYPGMLVDEIVDVEPGPEALYELRESVQLAFVAAIQQLPARQRAVLLLRDVLGWSAIETARLLDTSVASVNSALQRARATLERIGGAREQLSPTATDERQRELLERYLETWEASDMDGFAALLKEDAILRMPPWIEWYRGREAIAALFRSIRQPRPAGGSRAVLTSANGQPAFAHYTLASDGSAFQAQAIQVVTFEQDAIGALTAFLDTGLFPKFGLPTTLPL
ncbi:MAG: sigma-70 family RNA polymerase sigma factor [Chloroflexi bacterium]|nr:sigma-70 family RNA polymerase sigma factor [Chloroflexota bacterium]